MVLGIWGCGDIGVIWGSVGYLFLEFLVFFLKIFYIIFILVVIIGKCFLVLVDDFLNFCKVWIKSDFRKFFVFLEIYNM